MFPAGPIRSSEHGLAWWNTEKLTAPPPDALDAAVAEVHKLMRACQQPVVGVLGFSQGAALAAAAVAQWDGQLQLLVLVAGFELPGLPELVSGSGARVEQCLHVWGSADEVR